MYALQAANETDRCELCRLLIESLVVADART